VSKKTGELAELKLCLALAERQFATAWPDSEQAYDLIVEKDGVLNRVQVKSTSSEDRGGYKLSCRRGGSRSKRKYRKGDFDFLLAYVSPVDVWYVLPMREVTKTTFCLYPHRDDGVGQYEQYRNRFDLLEGKK
jgi:hypothetical protein